MERFFAILQVFLAGLFLLMAASTLVNMILIAFRPETISVVNALIGQTVLIVCFLALSRILFKKGRAKLTNMASTASTNSEKDHAGHHKP